MRIDKKRISNANIRGQIQITLDIDGLKESDIDPGSEVNVIYEKDKITIVKEDKIDTLLRKDE